MSKGSSLTVTSLVAKRTQTAAVAAGDDQQKELGAAPAGQQRPRDAQIEAPHRADRVCFGIGRRLGGDASKRLRANAQSSQGVIVTATKKENSIAIEALAGIGLI